MTEKNKIFLSIGAIILGWLLSGFALTTKLGHPTSTICLRLALALFFGGVLFIFLILTRK
ncbi:hypothetical protein D9M72_335310 [compost metagenome]